MGINMKFLLKLAIDFPGWHSYGTDRSTVDAVRRLVELDFIQTNDCRQFRLMGNAQLFRLKQDVADMKASQRTQFSRCPDCNRLRDTDLVCPYCPRNAIDVVSLEI